MIIDPTNQVSGQFSDFSHKGINPKIIAKNQLELCNELASYYFP